MAELAGALVRAGFVHASIVPGYPATSLQERLGSAGAEVVDAGNERSALELAFGWSIGGWPALSVIKGNGGWLAGEPIQNMVVHGIGAPLLVLIGDDVAARSSTVPTDMRALGAMAAVPVVDLGTGAAISPRIVAAARASASSGRPVILRFTGALEQATGNLEVDDAAEVSSPTYPRPPTTPHRFTKLARFQAADGRWMEADDPAWVGMAPRSRRGEGVTGVITSGMGWDVVRAQLGTEAVPSLAIELVHPFPALPVAEFCAGLERVLVVEEGQPIVEDLVQAVVARSDVRCEVLGQRTGHLPTLGAGVDIDLVAILSDPGSSARRVPAAQPHPAAGGTTFDLVLEALALLVERSKVSVHTCVGSCIAAAYPPHQIAMSSLELGAPIAVAAGAAIASGTAAVALVGDYGLFHSALEDHDLVHRRSWPVLTVVLADGLSNKTGGQPTPAASATQDARPVDLHRVLTRVGDPARVEVLELLELTAGGLADHLDRLLEDLPRTVVVMAGDRVFRGSEVG